jgi:hypothetical protein
MIAVSFYQYYPNQMSAIACANVAHQLAKQGNKVLVMDWDFVCPTIHHYLHLGDIKHCQKGLLELFSEYTRIMRSTATATSQTLECDSMELSQYIAKSPNELGIDFMFAGHYALKENYSGYHQRYHSFKWYEFYEMLGGVTYIELFKLELAKLGYDYVLLNCPSGITDYSGICSIQIPDINLQFCSPLDGFAMDGEVINRIATSDYAKAQRKFKDSIVPICCAESSYSVVRSSFFKEFVSIFDSFLVGTQDEKYEFVQNTSLQKDLDFDKIGNYSPNAPAYQAIINLINAHRVA